MSDLIPVIELAIAEADRALRSLGKSKSAQVSALDEREYLKAVALSWLRNHRKVIAKWAAGDDIEPLDAEFQLILTSTGKRASRMRLVTTLKSCRKRLVELRSTLAILDTSGLAEEDGPPSFAPLAGDKVMQDILARRWQETIRCIEAGAYLAATVMMGGLVEALLVARASKVADKSTVFTAAHAPKDNSGKTLQQKNWTLRDYIDVAHELGWITQSAKDVGEVLRDYRNYVHPHKEYSHRVTLAEGDASMFWGVAKSIASQVIKSAG